MNVLGETLAVCLSGLPPLPQPCHQYAQSSQQARFRVRKCVRLTRHPPHSQKHLSFRTRQLQGGQRSTPPHGRSIALLGRQLGAGDRPALAAAITSLRKHTALWSLTAVKATSITSAMSQNKLSSQTAAPTLQQLPQPTHSPHHRKKPASNSLLLSNLYHPPASSLPPLLFLF